MNTRYNNKFQKNHWIIKTKACPKTSVDQLLAYEFPTPHQDYGHDIALNTREDITPKMFKAFTTTLATEAEQITSQLKRS